MAKVSAALFLREVRQEVSKVSWPTRKETLVTTGMVLLFTLVMALFFLGVDQVIAFVVRQILGLGG